MNGCLVGTKARKTSIEWRRGRKTSMASSGLETEGARRDNSARIGAKNHSLSFRMWVMMWVLWRYDSKCTRVHGLGRQIGGHILRHCLPSSALGTCQWGGLTIARGRARAAGGSKTGSPISAGLSITRMFKNPRSPSQNFSALKGRQHGPLHDPG